LHPLFAATLNHLFTLENARLSGRFRVPGNFGKNVGRDTTPGPSLKTPNGYERSFYRDSTG
jgi:hypothetical protein